MTEYNYSVREVVRDPDNLCKELLNLGENGWELVTILEKSLPSVIKARTGWIIVSKKVIRRRGLRAKVDLLRKEVEDDES